jgi:hypothetical protein
MTAVCGIPADLAGIPNLRRSEVDVLSRMDRNAEAEDIRAEARTLRESP